MQGTFTQFKAKYILLDFILIFFILIILVALILVVPKALGLQIEINDSDPIMLHSFGCLFMSAVCFTTFLRLKKCGIRLKQLVGTGSIRELPWLMLLTVFYGEQTLSSGISKLTTFFTYLLSPNFTKSALVDADIPVIYNTQSLPLQILFFILLTFSIAIVAPITEEFIFRGVLLHRLAAKWGVTWGVVLSSVFFGLAHLNIHSLSIGVSSIVTALIYLKTQMLIVPIIFHALNNLIFLISRIVYKISYPNDSIEITLSTFWNGLLNTALALPILIYFLKWPSRSDLLPYTANNDGHKKLSVNRKL